MGTELTVKAPRGLARSFDPAVLIGEWQEDMRSRVEAMVVAFSGGKDSLTTLDLVQRALPPDAFFVIFGDTGMELKVTHQAVERTKAR